MSFLDFAKTPPMGWNSWDCYGASVTEKEVKENADYMAKNMKQYGWEYVVIDIQWSEPKASSTKYNEFFPLCIDEYSRLIPAENRFPSSKDGNGFKRLSEYIHSKGLKFGIHIMRGIPRQAVHNSMPIKGTRKTAREIALNNICPWNSDMYGVNMDIPEGQMYYDSLIELYESWDVDFIKVDDISYSKLYNSAHKKEICGLRKAIDKSSRPIVLSLSPGPAQLQNGSFFQNNANMWRLTDDFWDNWESLYKMFNYASEWTSFIRPGNWPDCDMLPLGHIGIRAVDGGGGDNWTRFTKDEQYTLMSLWTIFQSPLMYGGTLPDIDPFTLKLLTNKEILEMHSSLNNQREIFRNADWSIWSGCSDVNQYIAYFNVSNSALQLNDVSIYLDNYDYLSMWEDKKYSAESLKMLAIPSHGVCVLKRLEKNCQK